MTRAGWLLPCAVLALTACSASTTPRASSSPAASTGASGSPATSASPSATTLSNQASTYTLTAEQLPESPAGTLSLLSDTLLSQQGNTDARLFTNANHSLALEIDVLPDTSASTASNDYNAVRDAARGRIAAVSATASPNIGDQADEFSGTASDGKGVVAVVFQQGSVLAAVLTESSGTASLTEYAETVAAAEAQKIKSLA